MNLNANVKNKIPTIGAYVYLYIMHILMIYYYSYHIRITNWPLGVLHLSACTLGYYMLYLIINHLFIKKHIPKRTLIIIESLLLITLLTIYESSETLWSRF